MSPKEVREILATAGLGLLATPVDLDSEQDDAERSSEPAKEPIEEKQKTPQPV